MNGQKRRKKRHLWLKPWAYKELSEGGPYIPYDYHFTKEDHSAAITEFSVGARGIASCEGKPDIIVELTHISPNAFQRVKDDQ